MTLYRRELSVHAHTRHVTDTFKTHWHAVTSHIYVLLCFSLYHFIEEGDKDQIILKVIWSDTLKDHYWLISYRVTLSDMGVIPENSRFIDQSFPLKDPICSGCIWVTLGTGPGVNHSCHCVRQTGVWCHCFKCTHHSVITEQTTLFPNKMKEGNLIILISSNGSFFLFFF